MEIVEIHGYQVTDDPKLTDGQKTTGYIDDLVKELYAEVHSPNQAVVKRLKKAIKKYPRVPQFYNYLITAYTNTQQPSHALQVCDETIRKFPGYIFARLNKAEMLMEKRQFDEIGDLFEGKFKLSEVMPGRKVYHISEMASFYLTITRYFNIMGDKQEVEKCFDVFREISNHFPRYTTEELERVIAYDNMLNVTGSEDSDLKRARELQPAWEEQRTQVPVLHHSEMELLYRKGEEMPFEEVQKLLELPVDTLREDLEAIVRDAWYRFDYFLEQLEEDKLEDSELFAPVHAVSLLSEVGDRASLEVLLWLMEKGSTVYNFWFDGFTRSPLLPALARLGEKNSDLLWNFLQKPGMSIRNKIIITEALVGIWDADSSLRDSFVEKLGELLNFMKGVHEDPYLMDYTWVGHIIWLALDFEAMELKGDLRYFYKKGLVEEGICGPWHEVEESLEERNRSEMEIPGLQEIYEDFNRMLEPMEEKAAALADQYPVPELSEQMEEEDVQQSQNNVGRNDPCPCGSGKKYKKCCM